MKTRLTLHQLQLPVTLGWPDQERTQKQFVSVDITIEPEAPPRACLTDHLDDTVCYDRLIAQLKQAVDRPFHLLEHLAQEIFTFLKPKFAASSKITVQVTKKTDVPGLHGGASFQYGDP